MLLDANLDEDVKFSTTAFVREAIDKLDHESFNCILLDLALPDGNGLEVLKHSHSSDTPAIILTYSLFSMHVSIQ